MLTGTGARPAFLCKFAEIHPAYATLEPLELEAEPNHAAVSRMNPGSQVFATFHTNLQDGRVPSSVW